MSLERDLGRMPTNDEMAEQLDMNTEKYNKMIRLTRRSISLELPKYQQNPKDLGHESDEIYLAILYQLQTVCWMNLFPRSAWTVVCFTRICEKCSTFWKRTSVE